MRAGSLRHPVTIQETTTTTDDSGGVTETWTTHKSVDAAIRPLTGQEGFLAQQVPDAATTHEISIRYLSTVTPLMRVLFGSRIFNIRSVLNVGERNRETLLMTKEKV